MQAWLPIAASAVVFVVTVVAVYLVSTRLPHLAAQRQLEQRLRDLGGSVASSDDATGTLIKRGDAGPMPGLGRLASAISGFDLGNWIQQSGVKISVTGFVLASAVAGALLALVVLMLTTIAWAPIVGFALGATLPGAVLRHKRRVRLRQFEEQFPEALDLISRAVRAGHAFTAGMKMVADELGEPVGPEFRKTFDEQNFGLSLKDALNNLAARVPILDVRFFVTAVLIQRDTGGNLSEVLDNLAHVVRERFKILRQVRVYTAHGRFTGYVLLALPAALAIALMFINPEHMNLLFREQMGQWMLVCTIVLQTIGYLWIRQVIKIEV